MKTWAADRVVGLIRSVSRAREMRGRMPPRLTTSDVVDHPPTVFYLAPDLPQPSGGTRTIYRHVDLLNAAGVPAAVIHEQRGFRCRWFANETRVVAAGQVRLGPDDLLVVPEWYAVGFDRLPAATRKVIFNQGPYHTFDRVRYDRTGPGAPYTTLPNLVGILTVSRDAAQLLRCTFPGIAVHHARAVVDGNRFRPPDRPAGRRIAYMPRRRAAEREHLFHILRARGSLTGWELVPIDGRSEAETAELMRSCAIFLSFSEREGFGLPPAEAMASGCYVVGFTGLGGRDYFDPAYCTPVAECDLYAYVMAVEEAMRRYDASPESLAAAGLAASARILGYYHEDGLREDLLTFYQGVRETARPQPAHLAD